MRRIEDFPKPFIPTREDRKKFKRELDGFFETALLVRAFTDGKISVDRLLSRVSKKRFKLKDG
jgi:hypothetical protein